ncbi:ABC transporter substrate-binding protein [Cryptosporangium japonicum]|uniref:ABC transporter substrate-binding protein n=1 Tax=Cryptosporangium japonicum TaxID=80872 RepID=A0ABN0TGC1_9ACTN
MRRFRLRLAAAVAIALLAVSACSDPSASEGGRTDGTLVVATSGEPDNLNPILGYGSDGGTLLFDGLVARDASNKLIPALANALPTVSPDGKTVTATLRDGVTFSDGTPLTADDVVFTYRSVLDPKIDSTIRSDLDMLATVEAQDFSTVVFTLKYAYAPFLQRLALGIVPAKAFAGQDVNKAPFNRTPIGTGAYTVDSWTAGDRLVLTANPKYWGGAPANDRVIIAFVEDDNVRAQRARAGEFDAAELAPKLAASFANVDGYRVEKVASADYRGVMLPFGDPVTGDVAIRRALNQAVDRAAMVQGVLGGSGEPAFSPVPPSSEFVDPTAVGKDTADATAATAALEGAGWKAGSDGIRARGGQKAEFTLMYPAADSLRKELALAVTADAKKVGIKVNPEGLTWDAIEPRMKSDALIMGWGTPFDPDFVSYQLFHSRFAGQGFFNPGFYKSPATDKALQDGRDHADTAARKAAYSAFQKQLAADVPWIFLTYLQHTYVVRDSIQGVSPRVEAHDHGTNAIWWNIRTWKAA